MNATRRRKTPCLGRAGFTLVEMFSSMLVVGILAGIAIPQLRGPIGKADAAKIYGDFNAVRQAAYDFLDENGRFPTSGTVGQVPAEMQGDVPQFSYKGMNYWWIGLDLRGAAGGLWGARALGILIVEFNGHADVAEALRDRQAGFATKTLLDFYWAPTQAMFVLAE